MPEPGVDTVGAAEIADRVDAVGDRPTCAHRVGLAVQGDRAIGVIPPAAGEATVAPAWPAAADVLLQHDHFQVRFGLGQVVRGPQASEPAADYDDVRFDIASQRRAGKAVLLGRQRLAKPPAALGARRQRFAGEVQCDRGCCHSHILTVSKTRKTSPYWTGYHAGDGTQGGGGGGRWCTSPITD